MAPLDADHVSFTELELGANPWRPVGAAGITGVGWVGVGVAVVGFGVGVAVVGSGVGVGVAVVGSGVGVGVAVGGSGVGVGVI